MLGVRNIFTLILGFLFSVQNFTMGVLNNNGTGNITQTTYQHLKAGFNIIAVLIIAVVFEFIYFVLYRKYKKHNTYIP